MKKEIYGQTSLINIDVKTQQNISKYISAIYKRKYILWLSEFIPGMQSWFHILKNQSMLSTTVITKEDSPYDHIN